MAAQYCGERIIIQWILLNRAAFVEILIEGLTGGATNAYGLRMDEFKCGSVIARGIGQRCARRPNARDEKTGG